MAGRGRVGAEDLLGLMLREDRRHRRSIPDGGPDTISAGLSGV